MGRKKKRQRREPAIPNTEMYKSAKDASRDWQLPYRAVKLLCEYNHIKETIVVKSGIKKLYYIKKDRKPPTEEELFKVGYNYPENCVTFFSFFRRYFRNNLRKFLLIILLILPVVALFIRDLIAVTGHYSLYSFLLNVLLCCVIIIYFFIADSVDYKINSVPKAFMYYNDGSTNENYAYYSGWYSDCARVPLSNKLIKKLNSKGCKVKKRNKWISVCYVLFCLFWVAALIAILYYTIRDTTLLLGWSGILSIVLFVAIMMLLSQSYFNCLVFVSFFQLVSGFGNRNEIKKYRYNKNSPSQTSGLVQLLEITNDNAGIYLTISIILSATLFLLLRLRNANGSLDVSKNHLLLAVFICHFLFAIASAVVVNYAPKLMLRRILRTWVTEERSSLEEQLFKNSENDEKPKHEEEKTISNALEDEKIANRIRQLKEDRINLNDDYFQLVLTAIGLLAPVATFVVTLIAGL